MIRIMNSQLNAACALANFYPDQLLDFHLFERLACANEVSASKQVIYLRSGRDLAGQFLFSGNL